MLHGAKKMIVLWGRDVPCVMIQSRAATCFGEALVR